MNVATYNDEGTWDHANTRTRRAAEVNGVAEHYRQISRLPVETRRVVRVT